MEMDYGDEEEYYVEPMVEHLPLERVREEVAHVDLASTAHLKLLLEEKFCDVVFLVGPDEQRVQCHRLLLAARSKVFEVMFSLPWIEGKEQIEEKIPDTDVETFKSFLKVSDLVAC